MLIECDICNALVESQLISSYIQEMEYDWVDNMKFSFCKCSQCNSPILIKQEYDLSNPLEEINWGLPKKIYPNNLFHINPVIPDELQISLVESIKCFKSGAYTATAMMSRKTLENFCILKNIKESNLATSIKKLKENGTINEQLFDWADELRLAGNKAAHDINPNIEEMDAKDILDFTIAILDFTYSFKDKFDKFKRRTQK